MTAATTGVPVLVVEDDPDHRVLLARVLTRHQPPFDVTCVSHPDECVRAVAETDYGLILLDYSLPGTDGLAVLADLRRRGVEAPIVMITAQGDERIAVAAMSSGATDYVLKTAGYVATIPTVVYKVLRQHELHRENARLFAEAQQRLHELEAAQERLVRVETLRALGELASGTAHHLNNLLAVITARVDLLLARSGSASAHDARALGIIRRAARDGAEVVRRIQEFARTSQLDRRALDLGELAHEVVEMTRARWHDAAQAQGIAIAVELDLSRVPRVLGHAASLREVLTNLVLNAVDALPHGGHITISTRVEGDAVALAVRDDGIGMSQEVRQRAQEPFFTTKGARSTGLGLAVNYGIMKRHRGDLVIESAEGHGTTVTIRVPLAREHAGPVAESPAAIATAPGALSVLVVDDQEDVREAIGGLVESYGHTVRQADGGPAALREMERDPGVDLVITDFGMPGMTGHELAREVKQRWPAVKVALMTGWGADDPATPVRGDVVDAVLGKPVGADELDGLFAALAGPDVVGCAP